MNAKTANKKKTLKIKEIQLARKKKNQTDK